LKVAFPFEMEEFVSPNGFKPRMKQPVPII
jgi:hypothetical protein